MLSAAGARHPYSCAQGGRRGAAEPRLPTERGGSFFFFRGKVLLNNPVYSQGVRQKVWAAHHNRSNWVISDQPSRNFYDEMARATFCFAPTGEAPRTAPRNRARPRSARAREADQRSASLPVVVAPLLRRLGLGPARV